MARHQRAAGFFVPVANVSLGDVRAEAVERRDARPGGVRLQFRLRDAQGEVQTATGSGDDLIQAAAAALQLVACQPFSLAMIHRVEFPERASVRYEVRAQAGAPPAVVTGSGTGESEDEAVALCTATLRALRNAGLLKTPYRSAGLREVREVTRRMLQRLEKVLETRHVPDVAWSQVEEVLLEELQRFAVAQAIAAANVRDPNARLARFDATVLTADAAGHLLASNTSTQLWWEWYPGLDNDDRTLGEVYATLPAAPASAIPAIVRLFENPASWVHLRGAVDLETHDLLHILLGRGLLDQDEAFVLGFTMGSTKNLWWLERALFKYAVSRLYPEPYRIPRAFLAAYELGVEAGTELGVKRIYRRPLKEFNTRKLGDVRRELAIDTTRLRDFYRREQALLPGTLASVRLLT